MDDIKLIIKLDMETYKHACGLGVSYFEMGRRNGKTLLSKLAFAIRKGTLLTNFGTYIAGYMDAIKTLESKEAGLEVIDTSKIITVPVYDCELEEYEVVRMTIKDFLKTCTTEESEDT